MARRPASGENNVKPFLSRFYTARISENSRESPGERPGERAVCGSDAKNMSVECLLRHGALDRFTSRCSSKFAFFDARSLVVVMRLRTLADVVRPLLANIHFLPSSLMPSRCWWPSAPNPKKERQGASFRGIEPILALFYRAFRGSGRGGPGGRLHTGPGFESRQGGGRELEIEEIRRFFG